MSTERIEVAAELLTRDEVAERLKVSVRSVDRYIRNGKLRSVKVGDRLVRIPADALPTSGSTAA